MLRNFVVANSVWTRYSLNFNLERFEVEIEGFVRDTHREKTPSNETPTLLKSMNIYI